MQVSSMKFKATAHVKLHKSDHHGPLWTFATPRVPFNGVSGHPTLGEPVGDPVSEAGGHPRATPLAQPDRLPEPRNIFALGQDRPFVLVDLLNGPAGPFGDLFGGHPGTNHRLHVSWSHPALDLDLQLAQPGAVPTGGGAQRLVEGQAEASAVTVGEQHVPPVVVDADQPQVLHGHLHGSAGRISTPDSLTRSEVCEAATPNRLPWASP